MAHCPHYRCITAIALGMDCVSAIRNIEVAVQSIAGPLKNAYCVRKSSTITFLCNHAICNVRSFSTDLQLTVLGEFIVLHQ